MRIEFPDGSLSDLAYAEIDIPDPGVWMKLDSWQPDVDVLGRNLWEYLRASPIERGE
jgi:hypothetical protein